MSVPHQVSRAKLNSLLIQRIISQQKQARDAEAPGRGFGLERITYCPNQLRLHP